MGQWRRHVTCSALQRAHGAGRRESRGWGEREVREDLLSGGRTGAHLKADGNEPIVRDSWCQREGGLEVPAVETRRTGEVAN